MASVGTAVQIFELRRDVLLLSNPQRTVVRPTSTTKERRLPTASELGGLRTAPVLTGGRAQEIRNLLCKASPDAARQLVVV